VNRRRFLALCGAAGLAGCSAPGADSADGTTTETTTRVTSKADTTGTTTAATTDGTTTTAGKRTAASGTWPMYGFDAANTGYNPSVSGPQSAARKRWGIDISGVNSTNAPSVVDGNVFVANKLSALCLDGASGNVLWKTNTGVFTTFHSPAVADGTVYAVGRDVSVGGTGLVQREERGPGALVALNAADGSERWARDAPVHSSPVVDGNIVYCATTTSDGLPGVRAFAAANGRDRWEQSLDCSDTRATGVPAVADGRVYVTLTCGQASEATGRLVAFDAADGSVQWSATTADPMAAGAAVADGRAFVTTEAGTVHAFSLAGERLWDANPDPPGRSYNVPPAVADGTVYAGGYNGVAAVDAEGGSVDWTATTADVSYSSLAVADGHLYVGGSAITAVDIDKEAAVWSFTESGFSNAFGGPAVVDGAVYATACIKQSPTDRYQHSVFGLEGA
jgi:outer membrane protein assembly factor BamB